MKYSVELVENARNLALLGLTNERIAKSFGIPFRTFKKMIADNEGLRIVLQDSRDIADGTVAAGLFMRARGYEYMTQKHIVVSDGREGSHIEVVEEKVVVLPDVPAASLWLANRHKDIWKLRQQVEVGGIPDGVSIKIDSAASQEDATKAYLSIVGRPAGTEIPS